MPLGNLLNSTIVHADDIGMGKEGIVSINTQLNALKILGKGGLN